jgi:lipopolysaccharide export system protein LptC
MLKRFLIAIVILLVLAVALLAFLVSGNVQQSASAQATANRRITATANAKIILDCAHQYDPQSSKENSDKFYQCWKDGGFNPDLQLTPVGDSSDR